MSQTNHPVVTPRDRASGRCGAAIRAAPVFAARASGSVTEIQAVDGAQDFVYGTGSHGALPHTDGSLIANVIYDGESVQFVVYDFGDISYALFSRLAADTENFRKTLAEAPATVSDDAQAASAMRAAVRFYDFIFETYGRVGISNSPHTVVMIVGVGFSGTIWNGYLLVHGDGFVSDAATAHELAHAVAEGMSPATRYGPGDAGAVSEAIATILADLSIGADALLERAAIGDQSGFPKTYGGPGWSTSASRNAHPAIRAAAAAIASGSTAASVAYAVLSAIEDGSVRVGAPFSEFLAVIVGRFQIDHGTPPPSPIDEMAVPPYSPVSSAVSPTHHDLRPGTPFGGNYRSTTPVVAEYPTPPLPPPAHLHTPAPDVSPAETVAPPTHPDVETYAQSRYTLPERHPRSAPVNYAEAPTARRFVYPPAAPAFVPDWMWNGLYTKLFSYKQPRSISAPRATQHVNPSGYLSNGVTWYA